MIRRSGRPLNRKDSLHVGFIGLGRWSGHLAKAVERSGEFRITSCFARTESARRRFARDFDCSPTSELSQMLDDPGLDAVVIATPHSTHSELVISAALAGKHIFVEKPLSNCYRSGLAAVEAAENAEVVLQVGHNHRRHAGVERLRQMTERGELGQIHLLEAFISKPSSYQGRPAWRLDPAEVPLGGMMSLGIHMLDTLHYIVGPVKKVSAFSKRILGLSDRDDISTLMLEFESGPLGYLATSQAIAEIRCLAAHGTEGSAWAEQDGGGAYYWQSGEKLYVQGIDDAVRREEHLDPSDDPLASQFVEFAARIRDGGEPLVGGKEGLEVLAVMEGAVKSVSSGRAVPIARRHSAQFGST